MGAWNANRSDSDYRKITVWGAPLPFVYDMLNSQSIGQIDRRDYFSGGAFLGDWLFCFVVSWPLSSIVLFLHRFMAKSLIQRKKVSVIWKQSIKLAFAE